MSAQLQAFVAEYRGQAKAQVEAGQVSGDLDVNRIHRTGTAVLDQMQEVQRSGETPSLLQVPDPATEAPGKVTWIALLTAMLTASQAASTRADAKVVVPLLRTELTITGATSEAEEVRKRVGQAIDGNNADHAQVQALRSQVFGGREAPKGKAGWENELRTMIQAIKNLPKEAPAALRRLVPRLEEALKQVEAARPLPRGPQTTKTWSAQVLVEATALNLCLGALLSWAASEATSKRNAALQRIIAPTPRAKKAAAAAPAPQDLPALPAATTPRVETNG